jgi:NAD(P)-dependent dehydrogenase (short-subunit alcohol dehydrogenase family)
MDTNLFGPLNGLETILPLLLTAKVQTPKSIVITGSKQGITNPPGASNPAYNASKAAIKSMTEHLAHDLRSDPSTAHISVHLLIPGWTWTGLMGNVGPTKEEDVQKPAGAWYPSQVADELLKGLERGSFYIICPDGEADRALDQARMKWGGDDVLEGRPALSRWEENWKKRAEEAIQADARGRRS